MTGSQAAHAHDVHIVFHRLARGLFRRLKQRTNVDIKTQISKRSRHDFGAAVMPVLAHLGHQDARPAAFMAGKGVDHDPDLFHFVNGRFLLAKLGRINPADGADLSLMTAGNRLHGVGDLTQGGAALGRRHAKGQQIAVARLGAAGDRIEGQFHRDVFPLGFQISQSRHLLPPHFGIVHLENLEGFFLFQPVAIHAHDDFLARIDVGLAPGAGLFDAHLGQTGADGRGHATVGFHLFKVGPRLVHDLMGQAFKIPGTAPGVDRAADAGLCLQVQLGIAGDTGRKIGRQGNGLIQGVGVQRLGAAEGRSHAFNTGAGHVVEGILLGQRPARSLAMGAQGQRFWVLGVKLFEQLGPQQAPGPQLGHLHEVVGAFGPEKAQPRRKFVNFQARLQARAHIFESIGQRVGQLQVSRRAGLLHVVPTDGDAVEARHVFGRVGKNIRDDPHAEFRSVDVRIADHVFLEDIVLDRTGELIQRHALLLGRHDVESHHRQHRAVHGHRNGHLVQGNAVEQHLHVFDRIDRHAGLAHVADDARVVAVVAAMGRQIKRHRQPFLARGQIAAIEGVAFLGGRKSGVLAHGPGPGHIHRSVGAAQKRRQARHESLMLTSSRVDRPVEGLDSNFFVGPPGQIVRLPLRGAAHFGRPLIRRDRIFVGGQETQFGKIRDAAHDCPSILSSTEFSSVKTLLRILIKAFKPAPRRVVSSSPGAPASGINGGSGPSDKA